ncbi:SGNH/GDSL hydrolase family protein [Priestia flexa]|uniref:SGNH/GDSL hydrolase family protein n=1 Tax=Priestia flexa TaxID=86664 RepID=UPI00047313F4|nr:SGNH/GDSL hydrolase family protein [Priestia flexa]
MSDIIARSLGKKVEKQVQDVTAQLAEKAQKSEVRLKTEKISQTDVTEEFLQQMAGTTPINAVPVDNSITPKKTTFMTASENLIDPSKRSDGYNLNFSWNTQYSLNTDASMTAYTESFPTVNGEVIYSNALGRLVWYTSSDNVSGTVAFSWDSSLGLYKATVGGGVKSRVDAYISNLVQDGYWFVCKKTAYSGSKSKYGSSKLSDIVDSNVFSKKTELEVVKADLTSLKTPTANATFFVPKYLYCYESNKSSKWIPRYNVMTARNYNSFFIDITAGWGYFRDWERVQTQAADTVKIKNSVSGAEVYSKAYTRRSIDPATKTNPSSLKNVLWIGDSFSDAGFLPCDTKKQLVNDFKFTNLNFIGTKSDTINGVTALNEGRGGYTLDDFTKTDNTTGRGTTYPNPFLNNGSVNIADYMSRNGFSGNVDYAIIELGVNNIVVFNNDVATIKAKMKSLIDLILSSYPNCKIFLSGLVPLSKINASSDVFTHNSLVLNVNKAYEELCEDVNYSSKCIYVDTGVFFDTEYGYQYENKPYRGSSEQRKVQTDWLHPSEAGYYMMADTISSAVIYHM